MSDPGKDSEFGEKLAPKRSLLEKLHITKTRSPPPVEPVYMVEDPPLTPITLNGYKKSVKHKLLSEELVAEIRNLLPARVQLYHNWQLLYSLEQHGISLNTLYHQMDPQTLQQSKRAKQESGFGQSTVNSIIGGPSAPMKQRNGYLIVIKDQFGDVFGAYTNDYLRVMDHRRYYGNGECFLWKSEVVPLRNRSESNLNRETKVVESQEDTLRFKAFPYTGMNDYIIYSNSKFISIGTSNGKNGLYIDHDLLNGFSFPTETFGNEGLSKEDKFKIMGLEVWMVC